MRKVTIVSSLAGVKKSVMTDVETWGELKQLPEVSSLYGSNMLVVEKESRNTLSRNDARLPDGDFTLIFAQEKTKAGVTREKLREFIIEKLEDLTDDLLDELEEEIDLEIDSDLAEAARIQAELDLEG